MEGMFDFAGTVLVAMSHGLRIQHIIKEPYRPARKNSLRAGNISHGWYVSAPQADCCASTDCFFILCRCQTWQLPRLAGFQFEEVRTERKGVYPQVRGSNGV